MKFSNTEVFNFQGAMRGLRNPLESWSKSDSLFGYENIDYCEADWEVASYYADDKGLDYDKDYDNWEEVCNSRDEWLMNNGILKVNNHIAQYAFLGPKDLNLAQRMIKAGTSDSKFLRQIGVSVDITAPLYWY